MWQAHSCPSWAGPLPVLAWPGPGPASAVSHKTEGNIFQLYIDLASARLSGLANQNKQVIKSCVFSFSTPDYCDNRHRESQRMFWLLESRRTCVLGCGNHEWWMVGQSAFTSQGSESGKLGSGDERLARNRDRRQPWFAPCVGVRRARTEWESGHCNPRPE